MFKLCLAAFVSISPTDHVHIGSVYDFYSASASEPNRCQIVSTRTTSTAHMSCATFKTLYVKAIENCQKAGDFPRDVTSPFQ